jgi:RimJ/RimL family protein N-acetyltransferase
VHRVQATVDPLNSGSVRILERLGLRREGTRREDVRLADRWRDSHVYAVLEDEWSTGTLVEALVGSRLRARPVQHC